MTKQALNDWAIMNLSMEDRGQQPLEPEPAARGQPAVTAAGSFLTGELSYFGVCMHYRKPFCSSIVSHCAIEFIQAGQASQI